MTLSTDKRLEAIEVSELFHSLFGLAVSAADVSPEVRYSIAEYIDPDGAIAGYLSCDLSSGCRLAAALTQIPAGRAAEAMEEGEMPDGLSENLDEVFNICAQLLVPAGGSRVTLSRTAHGKQLVGCKELSDSGLVTTEIGLDVERYGLCSLTFVTAAS
ncbi:MAG TPA: hypothetical protein DDW52_23785 [Planctomycetaceae bacterium]|nr:hypothetical protein [Planctomycetaceae bacterium]